MGEIGFEWYEGIRGWIKSLDTITGPLQKEAVNQLKNQTVLEASQGRIKVLEPHTVDLQYIVDPDVSEGSVNSPPKSYPKFIFAVYKNRRFWLDNNKLYLLPIH